MTNHILPLTKLIEQDRAATDLIIYPKLMNHLRAIETYAQDMAIWDQYPLYPNGIDSSDASILTRTYCAIVDLIVHTTGSKKPVGTLLKEFDKNDQVWNSSYNMLGLRNAGRIQNLRIQYLKNLVENKSNLSHILRDVIGSRLISQIRNKKIHSSPNEYGRFRRNQKLLDTIQRAFSTERFSEIDSDSQELLMRLLSTASDQELQAPLATLPNSFSSHPSWAMGSLNLRMFAEFARPLGDPCKELFYHRHKIPTPKPPPPKPVAKPTAPKVVETIEVAEAVQAKAQPQTQASTPKAPTPQAVTATPKPAPRRVVSLPKPPPPPEPTRRRRPIRKPTPPTSNNTRLLLIGVLVLVLTIGLVFALLTLFGL